MADSEPTQLVKPKLELFVRSYNGGESCAAINCTNARAKRPGISFFSFPKDVESNEPSLKKYNPHKVSHSAYCAAPNCYNSRGKQTGMSFFSFPRDPQRCKKWVVNCRRLDLSKADPATLQRRGYLFCANHFETSQFMNAQERKRLIWNAVPTIFDVPNPPPRIEIKRPLPTRHPIQPKPLKLKIENAASTTKNGCSQVDLTISSHASNLNNLCAVENNTPITIVSSNTSQYAKTPKVSVKKLLDEIMELRKELERKRPYPLSKYEIVSPPNVGVPNIDSPIVRHSDTKILELRRLLRQKRAQISRLRKKVHILKTTEKKRSEKEEIEDIINLSSKYLPEKCHALFAAQLKHSICLPQGTRWDEIEREFAVTLRDINRKAYTYCSTYFTLPVTNSVRRWTKKRVAAQATTKSDSIDSAIQNVIQESCAESPIQNVIQESCAESPIQNVIQESCAESPIQPTDVSVITVEEALPPSENMEAVVVPSAMNGIIAGD